MPSSTYGLSPLLRAASVQQGRPVTGDQRWFLAGARDLERLTEADRELIAVVTGEQIVPWYAGMARRVSFFTLQIALDRITGTLAEDDEVSIEYLEGVHTAYEIHCAGDGNPVDGERLDLGLAWLVGRELARQDRISLVA